MHVSISSVVVLAGFEPASPSIAPRLCHFKLQDILQYLTYKPLIQFRIAGFFARFHHAWYITMFVIPHKAARISQFIAFPYSVPYFIRVHTKYSDTYVTINCSMSLHSYIGPQAKKL